LSQLVLRKAKTIKDKNKDKDKNKLQINKFSHKTQKYKLKKAHKYQFMKLFHILESCSK
jgi:hypothetical protein